MLNQEMLADHLLELGLYWDKISTEGSESFAQVKS